MQSGAADGKGEPLQGMVTPFRWRIENRSATFVSKCIANHIEAKVIAPDQYCFIPHPANDPLQGTDFGRELETALASNASADIPL